jgi:hypothetical protein
MEFWHTLPQRRVASNDEAFHALLLFVDGADPAADYDGRVRAMRDRDAPAGLRRGGGRGRQARGRSPSRWRGAGDQGRAVDAGVRPDAAVRRARAAVHEPVPAEQPAADVQRAELLGIIGRAEDYQRMFNEDALADAAQNAAALTAPPRGPARGNAPPVAASRRSRRRPARSRSSRSRCRPHNDTRAAASPSPDDEGDDDDDEDEDGFT